MELRDAWRGIKQPAIKDPWVAKTLVNIDTRAKQNSSPWDNVRNPWIEKPAEATSNIVQAKLNDPYQINSLLDVLFNEAALQKEYKSKGLKARVQAV